MQARNKPEEECVFEEDKTKRLEGLPRDIDTFWNADMSTPPCLMSGKKNLTYRIYNKGMSFTHKERHLLSIHGLLPYGVFTIQQQLEAYQEYFATLTSTLAKYILLTDLEASNQKLFFRLLMSHPDKYLKVFLSADSAYLVQHLSYAYTTVRGMYITIKDRGHVFEVLKNFPFRQSVRCIIASTGKSVLNLGDKGVNGTPIVNYKMYSNVVHGGIHPSYCLPVTLDVGTDNEALLKDAQYVGLQVRRVTGQEYDEFIEEFTLSVMRLFGPRTILQIKDFGSYYAVRHLSQYRNQQCFMDIDMQGLGACGLAGILAAMKITQMSFKDNIILLHGVTNFNIGIALLSVAYLKRLGLNDAAAKSHIWFYDSKGLVVAGRSKIPEQLKQFEQVHEHIEGLVESIDAVKPNILIGCGLNTNAFTKDVLRAMERSAQQPIIFAMSRPKILAECTADDAFVYTKGRCIFISGVDLPPLKYGNKIFQPGYCSSDYIISGLTLGAMLSGMTTLPDETFLVAAERLSNIVWPNDLARRYVFPPLRKLRCINLQIADAVFTLAYRRGWASLYPEPENPMEFIKSSQYDLEYVNSIPNVYCMKDQMIGTTESARYYREKI